MHVGRRATDVMTSDGRKTVNDGRAVRAARERAKQHRRIVEATRLLLASNDVDSIRVADIADSAGCSTATIHNHFPNALPDILAAISEDIIQTAFKQFEKISKGFSGIELVRSYFKTVGEHICEQADVAVPSIAISVDLASHGSWFDRKIFSDCEELFKKAKETEQINGSHNELARLTHTFFQGALYSWALGSITSEEFLRMSIQSVDFAVSSCRGAA